jgi:hypothetical protein
VTFRVRIATGWSSYDGLEGELVALSVDLPRWALVLVDGEPSPVRFDLQSLIAL